MSESTQADKQDLSRNGIDGRISQANGRLKSANVRARIERIGQKLYLQATLPPKPDSNRSAPYQQRIALGIAAHPAGISLAEKEARKISALLDCKQFSWEPYLTDRRLAPHSVGDWLDRFEAEFRQTVEPITWRTDYEAIFKKLPANTPLTEEILRTALISIPPNTKTRKRAATTLNKFAEFAGLEPDFSSLRGNYSSAQVEPRDLPDDAEIVRVYHSIRSDGWKWVYGMLATYGLRNHEVFYLDISDLVSGGSSIAVKEGKTGKRLVWSFYPEWVETFRLREVILPKVTGKTHIDYTNRVCKYFSRYLPFGALNLRHRWAIRTLEFGLPHELAAKQMGHSVTIHEKTYHRWLTAETHQKAFDALILRRDRPLPPDWNE